MNRQADWEQIRAWFAAAIDLPGEERTAWLKSHCPDPALRQDVLELLASAEADGPELFQPRDSASPAPEPGRDLEARMLGPYRIVRQLDAGGMGQVYLAERPEGGRAVAIKIIQRGLASDQALARFERERNILARLDHPAICPMVDSGTAEDGRPFLVMPFIEGAQAISDHCDQHRLDLRDRVRALIDVCQAVQHAHQKLVVHSDLKPGNVLMTSDGRVQLVDFGISRLLTPEGGDLTRQFEERRPATLDYAAPEQLRGEAPNTLSDVYSLGALMFRVLSGDKAYRVPTGVDAAEWLSRSDPTRRPTDLPADLFNICRKAMAIEPGARYASASALAEDLERWLEDRPVRARPPSATYLAAKFFKRHRWPVLTAIVAMLSIVVLATVLAWNNAQIARERDRAEAIADFWAHLFEQTDPVSSSEAVPSVPELLDRAVAELDGEDSELPSETRARLLAVISTSYWNLARQDQAAQAAEAAVAAVSGLPGAARSRAVAWKQLANIAMASGQGERAREAADAALEAMADSGELPLELQAQVLDAHALVLELEDELAEAAEVMERVIELQRRLPLEQVRVDHATAWGNLAFMYFNLARRSETPEPLFERAAAGVARSLELLIDHYGPDHARVAFMHNASGTLNLERGRLEAALADFDEAARIVEPTLPPGHSTLARLHYNRARLHHQLGRHRLAAEGFEEAYRASAGFDTDHPYRWGALVFLVRAWLDAGDRDAARQAQQQLRADAEGLEEGHVLALWAELFEVLIEGQSPPEDLRDRIQRSGDVELIDYLVNLGTTG